MFVIVVAATVGIRSKKKKNRFCGDQRRRYERGILAFCSSVRKLETNVSTGISKVKLLEQHVKDVQAQIEKVEIDYLRSYDLQKYLHRRVLVVLANKVCWLVCCWLVCCWLVGGWLGGLLVGLSWLVGWFVGWCVG